MSFLDNFKSHKKNNEQAVEQEFQRGLREGSWPEGVSDFQLMDNTGTFLPAYPDPRSSCRGRCLCAGTCR